MKKFVQLAHTQEENKTTVMVSIARNSERRNSDCLTAFGLNSKNMTEEQYNEVISLDKRLKELKGVYSILDQKYTHLGYYDEGHMGNHDKLRSSEELSPIKKILARHENIIRLEIKEEIENIKKKISEI